MSLTTAQSATLKADIQAQASLSAAVAAQDWPSVAAFYNAVAAPAVAIWRNDVKLSEFTAAVVPAELVTLTVQQQNALTFYMRAEVIDASAANVRTAFSAIFAAGATRTALTALAQRNATALEKLFGSGGSPITSSLCGVKLTADDAQKAMA